MNGIEDDLPAYCLSIFSFGRILFTLSTACIKSSIGKSTQYNLVGSVLIYF